MLGVKGVKLGKKGVGQGVGAGDGKPAVQIAVDPL